MRIRSFWRLAVLSLAALPLASCVEDIDLDREYERKVVVNCVLEDSDTQTLSLSYNSAVGSFSHEEITDAEVMLSCDGVEVGRFVHKSYMRWELAYTPEAGREYTLTVRVSGHEDITASTVMPRARGLSKIRNAGGRSIRYFSQRGVASPYWIFHLSQQTEEYDPDPKVSYTDRLIDDIGTNHPDVDDFNAFDEMMFAGTGLVGTTRSHMSYLRIVPNGDVGSFGVEGDFTGTLVVFRFPSVEYDRYMRSSILKMMSHTDETDPSRWFEEVSVYSNIPGGLGIFGAVADTMIQINMATDAYDKMRP